ncbi:MAG: ATP-binding SpoIIE family protein phosphatase [Egibacteraceae bacterium]
MSGLESLRRVIRRKPVTELAAERPPAAPLPPDEAPPLDIAPDDPLLGLLAMSSGAVNVDTIELDSPAVAALKEAGMKLVVPLFAQGELIGMLNLGPRLSEREYSRDDEKLLSDLAGYAAPAVRVAQLVREQEAEIRDRERLAQELRVATAIHQQFLPKELPDLPGWHVAAYYQPAREVGGDFYDFIELPDGLVGIVIGDVTDKGVPAALVMATTHSILRSDAPRLVAPGEVLARANQLLVAEMPPAMFVTCLYAVLDPATGRLRYANAGHDLPYLRTRSGVVELRATGMPLGLLPDMVYEEKETILAPGDGLLLHSDGLVEAHNADRAMFGFPRLKELVGQRDGGEALIDLLLVELDRFTVDGWEQEDDITLVTLQRRGGDPVVLADFSVPSEQGNEKLVIAEIARAAAPLGLSTSRMEKLKTAVAEATMNAIEHGNLNQPELPVAVRLIAFPDRVVAQIADQGGGQPAPTVDAPDLEAKLAGEQSPRGWGLFLIEHMVDELRTSEDGGTHTIYLTLYTKGGPDGSDTV